MNWLLADTVFGVDAGTAQAISNIGFAGGAVFVIGLLIFGKLVGGYLLDRSEARADKLQIALDKATEVNSTVPKAISDLSAAHTSEVNNMTAAHEREVAGFTTELRRLQDLLNTRQPRSQR